MSRADYGIDAPPVVRNLAVGGAAIVIVGIIFFKLTSIPHLFSLVIGYWGIFAGGSMVLTSLLMVWSSKVGKLHQREMLIASLKLKGNETVLDVGCGRGLLLNAAARHLPHGKAIGVDLWQTMDQSGNKPEVTLANARAEGVADRAKAIQEIHRVLKPGGQIALLDFMATDEYLASFQALGWRVIERSGPSFWMFPPVRVVSGRKPA